MIIINNTNITLQPEAQQAITIAASWAGYDTLTVIKLTPPRSNIIALFNDSDLHVFSFDLDSNEII